MNLFAISTLLLAPAAEVLQVGPGKHYSTICAALTAAREGDTVEVDSTGNYAGDVCRITKSNLTLRGVGPGRAHIPASGRDVSGKAILLITPGVDNTLVENMEFSGARVPDANGAGIRVDSGAGSVTVRNCHFHGNEMGMLTGDSDFGEIVVERSIFEDNGTNGQAHNIYVNHVPKFVFRGNYSRRSMIGHLVKSRAAETHILYNRLTKEDGLGSRVLDVPNGGLTYVIGNFLQQGESAQNRNFIGYQLEGAHARNPGHQLYVVNNTFTYTGPNSMALFVDVDASVATPVVMRNNIFFGPMAVTRQGTAVQENNVVLTSGLANAEGYDSRLCPGAAAIDAGRNPGIGDGRPLAPVEEYRHPATTVPRPWNGELDAGGLEFTGAPCRGPVLSNGASFRADRLAPGAIVSLFGEDLAAEAQAATTVPLPTTLAGVRLTFNGVATPLFFAGEGQVNLQIPYELAPGPVTLQLFRNGLLSGEMATTIQESAPGIFTIDGTHAVAQNQDYSLNTVSRPAVPGTTIIVYLTGVGPSSRPVATGAAAPLDSLSTATLPFSATIGGRPAEVVFLGLTPGLAGVWQANIVVPEAKEEQEIVITSGGVASNAAKVFVGGQ